MNGGARIAEVLAAHGTTALFTLCGGHISPILVEAKRRGVAIVDLRDERSAVFAADAMARLSGRPGVAAVTAGPGATNTVTAVKNAQMAQSAVVVLGGATGTLLRGRGSLQDIDQRALLEPHVKAWLRAERARELAPLVDHALRVAASGVPGPVFVECAVDLLYPEEAVRRLYVEGAGSSTSLKARLTRAYLERHVSGLFAAGPDFSPDPSPPAPPAPSDREVARLARALERSERPVVLAGSQLALAGPTIDDVAAAVGRLAAPVYLSGMARGLLGVRHPGVFRHRRREALQEADLVVLAGVPCDFRLGYGRSLGRARVASVNRSRHDLTLNRRPDLGILADPSATLLAVVDRLAGGPPRWGDWLDVLRSREQEREEEIESQATAEPGGGVHPLSLCRAIDRALDDDSVVVADGGDFVGTAAYTVSPRGPLRWLDPGPFGTLGVGGGFAVGAAFARPSAEIWLLWGDGSSAFSLAEVDTFSRHGRGMIAVIGNDASWAQIARDQVEVLGDPVGTELARTDYERVAEGYGGVGLRIESPADVEPVLTEAKARARDGRAVVVNAHLARSEFRKGSLSM